MARCRFEIPGRPLDPLHVHPQDERQTSAKAQPHQGSTVYGRAAGEPGWASRVIERSGVQKAFTGWAALGFVVVALISGVTPATATSGDRHAASASSRTLRWPAPSPDRVVGLVTAAGLVPETAEGLQYHVHAHL